MRDIALPDQGEWGPAMQALPTERQRAYVVARFEVTPGRGAQVRAAKLAGYGTPASTAKALSVIASRIENDERVQSAIEEEGRRRFRTLSPVAHHACEICCSIRNTGTTARRSWHAWRMQRRLKAESSTSISIFTTIGPKVPGERRPSAQGSPRGLQSLLRVQACSCPSSRHMRRWRVSNAAPNDINPAARVLALCPRGHRLTLLLASYLKAAATKAKSEDDRLVYLEMLDGLVGEYVTRKMLETIAPMSSTEMMMIGEALQLDRGQDKLDESYQLLTSSEVFLQFAGLNGSLIAAIELAHPRKETFNVA